MATLNHGVNSTSDLDGDSAIDDDDARVIFFGVEINKFDDHRVLETFINYLGRQIFGRWVWH